jgi:hypothetical protein
VVRSAMDALRNSKKISFLSVAILFCSHFQFVFWMHLVGHLTQNGLESLPHASIPFKLYLTPLYIYTVIITNSLLLSLYINCLCHKSKHLGNLYKGSAH